MKSLEQQIYFLDHILMPLYGIKSITDYTTIITVQLLEAIPNFLDHVNEKLQNITDVFPVKKFNLHKTNHMIETHSQSFNILVQCLEIAEIPHTVWTEMHQHKTIRYLRLSKKNLILENYIEQMAEKRNNLETGVTSATGSGSKREEPTEVIEQEELLKMVKNFTTQEYVFPLKNNQSGSKFKTGIFELEIPLNNLTHGIYRLETRLDGTVAPYNVYLEINSETIVGQMGPICSFEWVDPKEKEDVLRNLTSHPVNPIDTVTQYWISSCQKDTEPVPCWCNLLIDNTVIPIHRVTVVLGIKVFQTVINGREVPIEELIENAQLHCKITEPCFTNANLEKIDKSKIMIDLHEQCYEMVDHQFRKSDPKPKPTIPSEEPFDWIHVPDTIEANHQNLIKLLHTYRLTLPTPHLPFIDYHKIGHQTIAVVNRQFDYECMIHMVAFCKPKLIFANWKTLTDCVVTYIANDRIIHSYTFLRGCDTMNNIHAIFPTSIPIGTKVELFYGDTLVCVAQDEQGSYITLLPKMNTHLNLVGLSQCPIILKVSYPQSDHISEPIVKRMSYWCDTDERRFLATQYREIPLVDIEKLPDFTPINPFGDMKPIST